MGEWHPRFAGQLQTGGVMQRTDVSRRAFLGCGLAAAVTLTTGPAWAAFAKQPARVLGFHNTHTGENLKTVYWEKGVYIPEALDEINVVLRDHRTGDVHTMDPKLLDLLAHLRQSMDSGQAFEVISGYRSPKTNAMLAANSSGVAKKSLHMQGMAIDIRLPGKRLKDLRSAALSLKGGGVGYYPKSDFVHVDTGRVRFW